MSSGIGKALSVVAAITTAVTMSFYGLKNYVASTGKTEDTSVFQQENKYEARGKLKSIREVNGGYILETEILGSQSQPEALTTMECASDCNRLVYVTAQDIDQKVKSHFESLVKSDFQSLDNLFSFYADLYVTDRKEGDAYSGAVVKIGYSPRENGLLMDYIRNQNKVPTAGNGETRDGNTLFGNIEKYIPLLMRYVDADDLKRVDQIIENVKDGSLDGLLELSKIINWKQYQEEKRTGAVKEKIDSSGQRYLVITPENLSVLSSKPNTLDETVDNETKTEEVTGTLVGGKQYGRTVELRVKVKYHPELNESKAGIITFQLDSRTKLSPQDQDVLLSFLGKYTLEGCRRRKCGEYTFSADILPSPGQGGVYFLDAIELGNSDMKSTYDDMRGGKPRKNVQTPSTINGILNPANLHERTRRLRISNSKRINTDKSVVGTMRRGGTAIQKDFVDPIKRGYRALFGN